MSPPSIDHRIVALQSWLKRDLQLQVSSLKPASSDASFRRYFRVQLQQGCSRIVMDAPPDKENTEPFVRIAGLLKQVGLRAPYIYERHVEQGFLLLEDFGSTCLLDVVNADNVERLYQVAMDSLLMLQSLEDVANWQLPQYDQALLRRESGVFHEWFLQRQLGVDMPDTLKTALDDLLIESALAQPRVIVHRDFHSRNLMVLANDALGLIDFQDAVYGPISYDLVSLLRDCYIVWPDDQVQRWVHAYWQRLQAAGLTNVEYVVFQRWFDWMGLQRHLKAVGIFSRLHWRDNKSGYLQDIPRTLAYVAAVCARYPQLAAVDRYLRQHVLSPYL